MKEMTKQFYCPKGSEWDPYLWFNTRKACDAEGFEQPTVLVSMCLTLVSVETPTEL